MHETFLYGAQRADIEPLAAPDDTADDVAKRSATDPREWEPSSWLADIVPHMIYGMATVAVYDAIVNRQ